MNFILAYVSHCVCHLNIWIMVNCIKGNIAFQSLTWFFSQWHCFVNCFHTVIKLTGWAYITLMILSTKKDSQHSKLSQIVTKFKLHWSSWLSREMETTEMKMRRRESCRIIDFAGTNCYWREHWGITICDMLNLILFNNLSLCELFLIKAIVQGTENWCASKLTNQAMLCSMVWTFSKLSQSSD